MEWEDRRQRGPDTSRHGSSADLLQQRVVPLDHHGLSQLALEGRAQPCRGRCGQVRLEGLLVTPLLEPRENPPVICAAQQVVGEAAVLLEDVVDDRQARLLDGVDPTPPQR